MLHGFHSGRNTPRRSRNELHTHTPAPVPPQTSKASVPLLPSCCWQTKAQRFPRLPVSQPHAHTLPPASLGSFTCIIQLFPNAVFAETGITRPIHPLLLLPPLQQLPTKAGDAAAGTDCCSGLPVRIPRAQGAAEHIWNTTALTQPRAPTARPRPQPWSQPSFPPGTGRQGRAGGARPGPPRCSGAGLGGRARRHVDTAIVCWPSTKAWPGGVVGWFPSSTAAGLQGQQQWDFPVPASGCTGSGGLRRGMGGAPAAAPGALKGRRVSAFPSKCRHLSNVISEMILLNQESVTQGCGAQPPPGSSQAQPSATAGGDRRCPCPGPGPCLCPGLSPRPGPARTRSSPGAGAREPGAVAAPPGSFWGCSRRPGPGQGPRRPGRCSATSGAESPACVRVRVRVRACVALCACTRVRGEKEGWAMKGGEGSKGGKEKRERKTRKAAKWLVVTSPLICIGAGIKPPRQRAPFILACGAAAAASGGTEHHRAETPVGPAHPPGTPRAPRHGHREPGSPAGAAPRAGQGRARGLLSGGGGREARRKGGRGPLSAWGYCLTARCCRAVACEAQGGFVAIVGLYF